MSAPDLYVNGRHIDSSDFATDFDDHAVVLGADHDNGTQKLPMRGLLDEVRIYDRVLSDDEIAALAAM